jgi:hypothetical protein
MQAYVPLERAERRLGVGLRGRGGRNGKSGAGAGGRDEKLEALGDLSLDFFDEAMSAATASATRSASLARKGGNAPREGGERRGQRQTQGQRPGPGQGQGQGLGRPRQARAQGPGLARGPGGPGGPAGSRPTRPRRSAPTANRGDSDKAPVKADNRQPGRQAFEEAEHSTSFTALFGSNAQSVLAPARPGAGRPEKSWWAVERRLDAREGECGVVWRGVVRCAGLVACVVWRVLPGAAHGADRSA